MRALLGPKALTGKRVVITAGPTFEAIDPVRGITNRSSGKMGYALAQAALDATLTSRLFPARSHSIRLRGHGLNMSKAQSKCLMR